MKLIELVKTCANTGCGTVKIVNSYNPKDFVIFNDLTELEEVTPLLNRDVKNWLFTTDKKLDRTDFDFTLEIII